MNYKISNIVKNENLKILTLQYKPIKLKDLDLTILSNTEKIRFQSFKSSKRKREFYFTRVLWRSFNEFQEIKYSENGRPTIKDGFISISHSKNLIAISYSHKKRIGLDIEHYNAKIYKIKNKFLSNTELELFDCTDKKTITTLWSIKEAVYKLLSMNGISFKKNIQIKEIGEINRVKIILPENEKELKFSRLIFDEYILTYCT